MALPDLLAANAWTGARAAKGPIDPLAGRWALRYAPRSAARTLPAHPADPRDWKDPRVGWGVVLADDDAVPIADRAAAADAPEPIRRLVSARGNAPVFRYRRELGVSFLRRYYTDGKAQDTKTSGSERGSGRGQLPQYLLIYGPPTKLPWELQFFLNVPGYVGRLQLEGDALARYVDCLISGWAGAGCNVGRPVVWATDYGAGDITALMRKTIAEPVLQNLVQDSAIGGKALGLFGDKATWNALGDALATQRPGLVVTTSHGMTGPLDDPARMANDLGVLVDQAHGLLAPAELLKGWQPDGAIWYAHACCSAGADAVTRFEGLVPAGSELQNVLKAIAGLGARVAPLPRALLGAEKPLRAFVGHVEPTFDWTIKSEAGQPLTASIRRALYEGLFNEKPETIGLAMDRCFRHAGELFAERDQAIRELNAGSNRDLAKTTAVRALLGALDRQSMVILGDPTACLPEFPANPAPSG